jgi:peptidoglycan/LPS O-acetylase OafA/YrhL
LLLGVALAVAAYYAVCLWRHVPSEMSDRRFLTFFLAGLTAWLWRDKIPVNFGLALAAFAVFLCASRWQPFGVLVMPLAACYLVLWIGYGVRIGFAAWCDRVDLSYGTYLYAFPVQQMLAAVGIRNSLEMFALAVPLTLLLAAASWFIVEKPCLKLKSRRFTDRDPGAISTG